jgi:hypothetical protein
VESTDDSSEGVVRFGRDPELRVDSARLDIGSEVFVLEVSGGYMIPEYNYENDSWPEELQVQVLRGLAFADGRCREVRRERNGVIVHGTLSFPDGAEARRWLTPLQRLRLRLTGRCRYIHTSRH